MGSPISFSTSCSRISTNSRFENTASHSFFGNPTRISLCIEWPSWPSPSEGLEGRFLCHNGSLRSVKLSDFARNRLPKKGGTAEGCVEETTPDYSLFVEIA